MKMAAEDVLKDIRKLSVDELVALQCSVQNFGFEPEVRRGLEAKIQQRALKLMDRLNRQPNIYADLPDVEKLVKVFGEYNHERKLIYPVAHSLKIKIHKTKCYFEKNPVLREEALRQREQRRGKTFEIRFEYPETNREKKVVANEPQAPEPRGVEPEVLPISFTGNMFASEEEKTVVATARTKSAPRPDIAELVSMLAAAKSASRQEAAKSVSRQPVSGKTPVRSEKTSRFKAFCKELGQEIMRWQTAVGAAVILLGGISSYKAEQNKAEKIVPAKEAKATAAKKQSRTDGKAFTGFDKVQKEHVNKADTAAVMAYLKSGRDF